MIILKNDKSNSIQNTNFIELTSKRLQLRKERKFSSDHKTLIILVWYGDSLYDSFPAKQVL